MIKLEFISPNDGNFKYSNIKFSSKLWERGYGCHKVIIKKGGMDPSRLADLTPLFLMAQEPNQKSLAILIRLALPTTITIDNRRGKYPQFLTNRLCNLELFDKRNPWKGLILWCF